MVSDRLQWCTRRASCTAPMPRRQRFAASFAFLAHSRRNSHAIVPTCCNEKQGSGRPWPLYTRSRASPTPAARFASSRKRRTKDAPSVARRSGYRPPRSSPVRAVGLGRLSHAAPEFSHRRRDRRSRRRPFRLAAPLRASPCRPGLGARVAPMSDTSRASSALRCARCSRPRRLHTDWHNPRDVGPLAGGKFGLRRIRAAAVEFLEAIFGPGWHLSPSASPHGRRARRRGAHWRRTAIARKPLSTHADGRADRRAAESDRVNVLANSTPSSGSRTTGSRACDALRRRMRRVYPGFVQLAAFMSIETSIGT